MLAEPIEVLEEVPLEEANPEKFTRTGTSIREEMKQDLVKFLRRNTYVFTWSHEDMPGIDLGLITHCLNVSSSYKLVH